MLRRVGLAAVVLFSTLFLTSEPASAQSCRMNGQCRPGDVCEVTWDFWLFKIRECRSNARCNFDVDCNGGRCAGGACIAPVGGTGGGTSGSAEGRKCMPKDGSKPKDWALDDKGKPLGACPTGMSCSNQGYCRKLEQ